MIVTAVLLSVFELCKNYRNFGASIMKETVVKPERPGGFLDYPPADCLARERMIRTIERVYRSFGFDSLETPIVEFTKTLAGETSDTGKNIFHVKSGEADEPLALRFDHTVPFARFLAANPFDAKTKTGIRLPWRRMVFGPVFRGEKPQSGRYRQFYQFDVDIAGTESMIADAEIIAVTAQVLHALNVARFSIRINHRGILNGLAELSGIADRKGVSGADISKEMMRILDKADKIGREAVFEQLRRPPANDFDAAPNLSPTSADRVREFLEITGDNEEKLSRAASIFRGIAPAERGIEDLRMILSYLPAMEIPSGSVTVDFSIARGLDYYTGPVMESVLTGAPEFGSVISGGRYDDLVRRFTGQVLPATGTSIGVDRLYAALVKSGAAGRDRQTAAEAMVLQLTPDREADYINMAAEIRRAGVNTEVCLLTDHTFKAQFHFALNRGVTFAVICGTDEFAENTVQVKNLTTRKQEKIPRNALTDYFADTR